MKVNEVKSTYYLAFITCALQALHELNLHKHIYSYLKLKPYLTINIKIQYKIMLSFLFIELLFSLRLLKTLFSRPITMWRKLYAFCGKTIYWKKDITENNHMIYKCKYIKEN
jgi:hypothetical protein